MKVLVAGATGATGRLAAAELLKRGAAVRLIVRSPERLPDDIRKNPRAEVISRDISDVSIGEMAEFLTGCDAAVRPDSLVDQDEVSSYSLYASPVRSAIFNPGRTSRINVAHFMAELFYDQELWRTWKGKMPVIYNGEPAK